MSRHILIARRVGAAAPGAYTRIDCVDGRWHDAGLRIDRHNHSAFESQTALVPLIAGAIADLTPGVDLTLTTRTALDMIRRDPEHFDIPADSAADILCPIGRPGVEDEGLWARVLVSPGIGLLKVLGPNSRFVTKCLRREVAAILTPDDLRERNRLHDRREFWVRWGITAHQLAPDQVPAYPSPTVSAQEAVVPTPEEASRARARSARVRAASHSFDTAKAADDKSAATYTSKRAAEKRAEAAKLKKGDARA